MLAPFLRIVVVCWAVASATMPGLLAVADGVGESRAAPVGIGHAEAPDSGACPPAHDAHCAVCSLLRHHAATTPAGDRPVGYEVAARARALNAHAAALTGGNGSGRPRAPPAA